MTAVHGIRSTYAHLESVRVVAKVRCQHNSRVGESTNAKVLFPLRFDYLPLVDFLGQFRCAKVGVILQHL